MKRTSYSRFLARAAVTLLAVLFSFTGARAQETLTVYDGTTTNNIVPAYIYYFDDFTRSQFVIPADDLAEMAGGTISSLKFYTTSSNVPYTTVSTVDVYLMEVNYTTMTGLEPKDNDAIVYQGTLDVVTEGTGGSLTIEFSTPYTYGGGNLLVGIENTTDAEYKNISFYGQTVTGASWGGYNSSSLDAVTGSQRNFIPKTTFTYEPSNSSCATPSNFVASNVTAHGATLTWESEVGQYIVEYKLATAADDAWTAASEDDIDKNTFTLVGLLQNTTYNARVQAVCNPDDGENGYSAWRKVTFTTLVSCPAPTDLAVTLTPGNGSVATLAWTENGNPAATSWQICLNDDETNLIAAATNPFQLTGLTPETTYTAKVRAVGNDEYSSWTDNITFTPTDAYSITVNDGTATNSYVPVYGMWVDQFSKSQFIIPAADLADMAYGTINKLTFYAGADKSWGAAEFEVYMTEVSNTTFSETTLVDWATMDKVMNAGSLSIVDNKMEITLDAPYQYLGGNLMIGVLQTVKGTYSSCSWYGVSLDGNVALGGYESSKGISVHTFLPKTTFDFTPGEAPACARPTDLAASEIGPRSVKLNWTENGTATAWQICLNDDETNLIAADSNPFTLTGLTPETEYTAKVRATQDGGFSFWSKSVTFTTPVAYPAPTEVAAGEITQTSAEITWEADPTATGFNLQYRKFVGGNLVTDFDDSSMGDWTTIDADGDGYTWVLGSECGGVYLVAGGSLAGTGHNASDDLVVSGSYSNYTGVALTPDNYLVSPQVTLGGSISFWACGQDGSYPAEHFGVAVSTTSNTDPAAFTTIQEWTLTAKRVGAKVDRGTTRSGNRDQGTWYQYTVDLSAYSGQGYVAIRHFDCTDMFMLDIDDITIVEPSGTEESWTVVENVTSPYTIEGLDPETKYEVQVQAVYTGEYPGESRWTVTTFSTLVEVPAPTALAATEVGARTAVLSWTENGEATAWEICLNDDEDNLIAADSNPFTVTALTPETAYSAKVRSIVGEKKSSWSSPATFTTEIAWPAPTELAVGSLTSHSANISWTGNNDATSYNLRYGMLQGFNYGFETAEPWVVDDFAPCTTYDGDGLETYYFDGLTFTNQGFTGACIAFQNGVSTNMTAHSGNAFGTMFNPANGSPANDWLILPEITIQDGDVFSFWAREITDSYGPEIINVGVYGSTDGTFDSYLAQGLQISETTWTQYSYDLSAYAGQTIKLAVNCVSQDVFGFMIDDIFVGGINEWNTITGVTSPYTIEGLAPETIYDVQVQAVYGTDGESSWVASGFTTLTDNPVPYELAADLTANSATLTWTGEGDSYNVRYRIASTSNQLFYDEFVGAEQGDWTTSNLESQSGFQDGYFQFFYTSNPPQYLISPELSGLTTNETILEFYYQIRSSSYPETFMVGYSTTTNDIDAFTWSDEVTATNQGSWLSYTQMLPAGVKYFAIKCTSNDMWILYVSGFGIYEYTPESEWTTIAVTDAQATISGLATNNGYEYQVQSLKGDKTSDWSETGEFALLSLGNDATDISSLLTNNYGRQAHVTLANRNFAKGMWNTICLPFDLTIAGSAFEGATLKTFDLVESSTEEKITLKFTDALDAIEAGKPYIIKWAETASDIVPQFANVEISAYQGSSISNGGVNFTGNLDAFQNTGADADRYIYYLTSGNTLKYYAGSQPRTMYSCRAFFDFSQLSSLFVASEKIRNITLDFGDGEVTGISDINSDTTSNGDWYNVNGMKLNQQPSRKGLYIQNGRKVVIK